MRYLIQWILVVWPLTEWQGLHLALIHSVNCALHQRPKTCFVCIPIHLWSTKHWISYCVVSEVMHTGKCSIICLKSQSKKETCKNAVKNFFWCELQVNPHNMCVEIFWSEMNRPKGCQKTGFEVCKISNRKTATKNVFLKWGNTGRKPAKRVKKTVF